MEQLNTAAEDTICAISTAPGTGGIAVIRVSGTDTIKNVSKIWVGKELDTLHTHTAHLDASKTHKKKHSTK